MLENDLASAYRRYIACLNDRDLDRLCDVVDEGRIRYVWSVVDKGAIEAQL